MILSWLAFFDGLIAIVLFLFGMLSAHYGAVPPFTGFHIFVLGFFFGILGLLFAIIAIIVTSVSQKRRRGRPRSVVALILSLIVVLPIVRILVLTHHYPPINDITTDVNNSPEFVHAEDLPANRGRNMTYDKAKYAAKQEAGYPNLKPLEMNVKADMLFKKVEIIAGDIPEWRITYNDAKTRTLEGVATSWIFRFKDDFVIQVRPTGDGNESLVEMRSKSRVGLGDFGANYHRIESFFRLLKRPLSKMPPEDAIDN